jgi:16S rRNA (cytidine1402-2'-O)-methyltransferase
VQEISGILFIVATPIGNLGDISKRAIETLSSVDTVYAEDTRNSLKLFNYLGIKTPLSSLHEHNEQQKIEAIHTQLMAGKNLALISDAGTPLISDPGYKLVHELGKRKMTIVPIPGASAIISALSIAGIATNKFSFEGFLPAKPAARRRILKTNIKNTYTQVYYESSHRIVQSISDMVDVLGTERKVFLARELTKLYEQVFRGSLTELSTWITADTNHQKGEFVVIIKGFIATEESTTTEVDNQHILQVLASELPTKQAASIASQITKISKNDAYRMISLIKKDI